ncbi:MAG: zinc carboxypeptidase, partial [Flammeovirgaceae bacterium]|nr:zinc carboxypeptidase [Flammeovirgaceae bacterium]
HLIIIIDPCENPDGRERYVGWYVQTRGNYINPTLHSWEHTEPWPTGRFNHYVFDLNRDWAWQTQLESQQRIKLFQEWRPHVHIDVHEMGIDEPYFFGPGAEPLHEEITAWQREYHRLSGQNNAKYFDKNRWLYFTREVYDLFYPSYGDTWPSFNGTIGFTYEQAGGGRAGLSVKLETGDNMTLKDRTMHHFTASLSSLETAFQQKDRLLKEFNQFFETNINSPVGEYKSYLIKKTTPLHRLKAILQLLDKQQIQYGYAQKTRGKAYSYRSQKEVDVSVEEGDVLISAYQPNSRLLKVLFEPKTDLVDSVTYDLTAWSLPYVYDLETYAFTQKLNFSDKPFSFPEVKNIPPQTGAYAYLSCWEDFADAVFLGDLLEANIRVRYALEPFKIEGRFFERGTLMIAAADNADIKDFDDKVTSLANKNNQVLYPVQTGLVQSGKDFGSSHWVYVRKPKIALIAGPEMDPTSFGDAWHFFDQQLKFPVSIIYSHKLSAATLKDYNVLILTEGRDLESLRMTDRFLDFVSDGGRIIALDNAVDIFSRHEKTLLYRSADSTFRDHLRDDEPRGEELVNKFSERERDRLKNKVAGAIYRVYLEETHPIAFGLGRETYVLKQNNSLYPFLKEGGWNVAWYPEKDAKISGFAGWSIKKKIPQTLAIGIEDMGRGRIIYFADSPIFRGFWHSGKLLMCNAVFFTDY